jgi:hypothetical protein
LDSLNKKWLSMGSRIKKSKRSLIDEDLRSSSQKKTSDEHFEEMLDNVSLKDVPLEERRKEAQKPLYLTRYE